ncbi:isoleucine--tRNA ligase [Flectobacillus longus]|uniref:isoleucine--tRNA ligase n=1 Tax=Flectobacillus longus TaxID=2984207 RepID=UPI0024B810C5|nr:isoleucine--tRNA ligase [Flectobacillus longus]MDI9881696.1 isoleucine--tRNA ligase [Flectobacillus longus]
MKFEEYKNLDYAQVADEILKFWKDEKVFEKSVEIREGQPTFTFYEGPPSANGTPGIHHVMARAIKDIFCRYQTLKGKQVKRKGGWDTHGLPVELQVEKELGITKDDIGKKISVEEYNKKCRETVMKFTDLWNDLTEKMGYWVDLDDPYITYKNDYIESIWHLLKQLYDKGLLYKGYTIQPYSPAAGTGLSSHELNQPGCYREVKDTSLTAQFKVKLTGKSGYLFDAADSNNIYILAWTTTPWTLPANSALTVGKNIDYVLVKTYNPYTYLPVNVVLARDLVGKYFNEKGKDADFEAYKDGDKVIPWTVVMELKGAHLEGIEYEQLLPYIQPDAPAFRVILGDFVTTEDGTGVVHTAPTFGADDFRVAQQNGVPAIMVKDESGKEVPIVNRQGRFVAEITDFANEPVKEAYLSDEEKEIEREKQGRDKYLSVDERIAIKLKTENKAFNVQKFDHPYPHCWRTDKPVLYYPLDSWFIRTTAVKDKLIALNNTINWKPESTGTGRFGNWLENLVDWNLSRSRYWGTPLPIWRSEDAEEVCIGSTQELINAVKHALKDDALSAEQKEKNQAFLTASEQDTLDLHRPFVDEVYLVSASGKVMTRETDLIDVWFDSGAMPFAQWHYPFENKDIFEKSYPADFISEGVDQTRGWFFTLHAISAMISDSVAFKNVVSTGLVLDKNGNKMSKRLGNAVDPFETLKKYGADPTRWYMITNAQPWDNLKFDLAGVTEVRNKFFGTLTNTYNFFALYANLDGYEPTGTLDKSIATELDRWILSKLQTLVKEVDESFNTYEPTKAGRAIQEFVSDHLSNWYVRLGRRRFWKGDMTDDKKSAYETLAYCLKTVAQLMSPIAPFYGDWLFKNVTINQSNAQESVHLTDFPTVQTEWIDEDLETSMDLAQRICSLIHSLRKTNKIKVRQPLEQVLIPTNVDTWNNNILSVIEIIRSEVNIKEIRFIDEKSNDIDHFLKKSVKPNFKKIGPKYGKNAKFYVEFINSLESEGRVNSVIKALEKGEEIEIYHESSDLTPSTLIGYLHLEDVEIVTSDISGWLVAKDNELTVALDITITDELRQEGIAREFVNRVQNYRKDSGFEVTDKIKIELLNTQAEVSAGVLAFKEYISQEVQAVSLEVVDTLSESVEVEMEELVLQWRIVVA